MYDFYCITRINLSNWNHEAFLIKTCIQEWPRALPMKEGYISLSFIKKVCIGPERISLKPCRTWCGLLFACLSQQAEAVNINPDAFLPSLRDVTWASGSSGVFFNIHQHHIWSAKLFQNDRWDTEKLGPDVAEEWRNEINTIKHKEDLFSNQWLLMLIAFLILIFNELLIFCALVDQT